MINEAFKPESIPMQAPQPEAPEQIIYSSGTVYPAGGPAPAGAVPPPQTAPPAAYPLRAAYPRRRGTGRDLALAGFLLVFCFLLWDSLIWAKGIGLGEALGLFALLPAALFYLRGRPGRLKGYGLLCAALYALGSASLALSGDPLLKLLTMAVVTLLYLIVLAERLGLRTGNGLLTRIRDLFCVGFIMTFGRLPVGVWALTHAGSGYSARNKRTRAVLIGLLCAIPALGILLPLLISSDAAFAGLMGKLDWDAARKGLLVLIPAFLAALMLFTLLFTSDRGPQSTGSGTRKGVEPAAAAAFLGAIGAFYVLYLVAQLAYFTDAFRGLLPKGFTVAEYARRGFFEMCAIVAINLGLIVLALGLCRKEEGRVPGAVKGLALFLCLFSLMLVATAISKMVLYMRSFGLTRLRVLTSSFMVFLALVVIAKALQLFIRKVPVAQLAVTLGAAILIALSLMNVDGLVARYNVDAWRTGKLDSLDMKTICELGDGATPVLAELTREKNPDISARAYNELAERIPTSDWRSWNLVTAQANEALDEVTIVGSNRQQ